MLISIFSAQAPIVTSCRRTNLPLLTAWSRISTNIKSINYCWERYYSATSGAAVSCVVLLIVEMIPWDRKMSPTVLSVVEFYQRKTYIMKVQLYTIFKVSFSVSGNQVDQSGGIPFTSWRIHPVCLIRKMLFRNGFLSTVYNARAES